MVILDVQMPVLGGLEATVHMRQWEKEKSLLPTPIIIQTGDNRTETRERALAAGASRFLGKPYCRDDLIGAIAQLVSGKR